MNFDLEICRGFLHLKIQRICVLIARKRSDEFLFVYDKYFFKYLFLIY